MDNFTPESYAAFHEAATDKYDFKQCKKADGIVYGIPDKSSCVLGKEYKAKEVEKANKDLFASAKKMVKSIGNLDEFNKALAEFTKANGILHDNTSAISKLPLKASSNGTATRIATKVLKALSNKPIN